MASPEYTRLRAYARRISRRADEADDLLQQVLLAAVEAGRADLENESDRRWLVGAMRRHAAFEARTAIRRRRREGWVAESAPSDTVTARGELPLAEVSDLPHRFLDALPSALRTTALLALSGHDRREAAWLLGVSQPALRQRIADLRRRWRRFGGETVSGFPGLRGPLDYGRIRRSLHGVMARIDGVNLGSHDPDGHPFLLSSRFRGARQHQDSTP